MIKKNVCLLGATAVGKTSIFNRLFTGTFAPNYVTSIGMVTDKITRQIEGIEVLLNVCDTEGQDKFKKIRAESIYGSNGYFLVIDGTRPETLEEARELNLLAKNVLGENIPFVALANKCDLGSQWAIGEQDLADFKNKNWPVVRTSAMTGEGVEAAVDILIKEMIGISM